MVIGYAMSGTAVLGMDYTLGTNPGQLVMPAGQRTVTVTLTALNSLAAKSGQTATMTLKSGTGYKFDSGAPSTTVTIN